jgi:predicted alpha-1,2-mannosidase
MGFSHTHLSGTGIGDMMDFLVAPRVGDVRWVPGTRNNPDAGYRSRFRHEDEVAEPGYYSVFLQNSKIFVELTASARAGMHRYTYPAVGDRHLLVDLAHVYGGPERSEAASLTVQGKDMLLGGRTVAGWANGRVLYFAIKFSRPFQRIDILADGVPWTGDQRDVKGKDVKCAVHFDSNSESVLVKTGISAVNEQNALANLEHEIPAWEFDQLRAEALQAWEKELGRIQVGGGTPNDRRIFYTSLYHTMLAPTLFSDVDGRYRGMDGEVHQLKAGENNYSTFSLWDTYRAAHPLYTLFQPERVPDFVNCLIRMGEQSPVGMPVWPLQGKETQCMTGYHSSVVIAEALEKGFGGIDAQRAYKVLRQQATENMYRGLDQYRNSGYVACDLSKDSIGETMDYAYNDYAVAHIARRTGAERDAEYLLRRSRNYRVLYDRSVGFIRPRLADGTWSSPFATNEMGYSRKWRDYTESNPWTATFSVQGDVDGLAEMLGGRKALEEKLDGIFSASSELPPNAPLDIAGLVGQYAHGNEPGHHIAYLYTYAGTPEKTQRRVASLLRTMYTDRPDGLAGNEDCGQMSAWYVMSAMGLYMVDPVSTVYVLGSPLFDSVRIDMGAGRSLMINTHRQSPTDTCIWSALLNGSPQTRLWFRHEEVRTGGEIVLEMAGSANPALGTRAEDLPPPQHS